MSTFHTGQRLRVKDHSSVIPEYRGTEVIFVGYGTDGVSGQIRTEDNCRVRLSGGGLRTCEAEILEPIVPPHEASQYSYTELMDRLKAGEVECV